MRALGSVVVSVFAFLLAVGAAYAGESPVNADGYWSCQSVGPGNTHYFSAVFEGNAAQPGVKEAFAQMLAQKYGYKDGVTCGLAYKSPTAKEKAEADEKSYAAQLRAAGVTVIETGWVFQASAASLPYYCYGATTVAENGKQTTYFYHTAILQVSPADESRLKAAWSSYLKALHPGVYPTRDICLNAPTDPAKQPAWMGTWDQQWKAQAKIVAVDWKLAPASSGASGTNQRAAEPPGNAH
jgi:hypothetical protein